MQKMIFLEDATFLCGSQPFSLLDFTGSGVRLSILNHRFFSPVRYKPGLNTVNNMVQAAIVPCLRTAEVKESCLLTRHYHPRNVGVLMTRRVHLSSQQIWKTSKYGMKKQNSGCTKGPDARAVYTAVTVSGEYLLRADLKGNKDQTTKTYVSAVQMW